MAIPPNLRHRHRLFVALLTFWCFRGNTSSILGSRLHEKVLNSTRRAFPLDDFNTQPRCDLAGIVAKFLSWEHIKSDEIAGKLGALAQEMIDYSKFHRDAISSWEGNSTVRTSNSINTYKKQFLWRIQQLKAFNNTDSKHCRVPTF